MPYRNEPSEPVANGVAGIGPNTKNRIRKDALRALNLAGPTVYAMRLPDGVIKIGHSAHLADRRTALQGEMLAVRFGDRDDEQAIHATLIPYRHHGHEYYHPTPEVLAVVNEMRAAFGLDAIAS